MSLLHGQKSFLDTNAWQKSNLNSLRYNTSQPGSVIALVYGKTRKQINLIALGDYRGASGKKGKNGPLPLGGQHVGKGGGGGGKKGASGKKGADYSVDVAFALCQGPVDIEDTNFVWASAGTAFFQSVGLNLYTGTDGQAADPVFAALGQDVGYSGTCYVTGTPMDLGSSPVLPNLSFEITGFLSGTSTATFPVDANPADVVQDFLTAARYGAGWPSVNLDPDIATAGANNYKDYCDAGLLAISVSLESQTDAATWLSELARLTNTAIVWSGTLLKFVPYGDLDLNHLAAEWHPNLTPLYSFTDDDFLPWTPHIDAHDPQLGEDDPVLITRNDPADATNWMSMEYLDRDNFYNKTLIPQFDQAGIDQYGVRSEPAVQGNCFCNKTSAEMSLRLLLQRARFVRNTYRFQVGWQYSLLEPMDIVLLTDPLLGLFEQPVRITAIEENENGDLIIDAEEILVDPTPIITGCVVGGAAWRDTSPGTVELWSMPPDRIDAIGNYYTNDRLAGGDNLVHIWDTNGADVATITYDDLWSSISDFVHLLDGPSAILLDDEHREIFPSADKSLYYGLWPIYGGQYLLAFIRRRHGAGFSDWWAVLDAEDRSVLGAHWHSNFSGAGWPYTNGIHVLGAVSRDEPILVQTYAFLGGQNAVIGILPSINEYLAQLPDTTTIPNDYVFPIGGTADFGYRLLSLTGGAYPHSRNFGFILPAADGSTNYYIYANRVWMDDVVARPSLNPPEFINTIQPAQPNGCMIKIPHAGSDAYSIDNSNWIDIDGVTAFPFLDEYTHISDDTSGGTDAYSLQTGVIDRGGGKFWVIFYMPGYNDADYRAALNRRPFYERIRIFEYTQSTETAREIVRQTCILHDDTDLPDVTSRALEYINDAFQNFSIEQAGNIATLYIHGYLWKRKFMTFAVPLDLLPAA